MIEEVDFNFGLASPYDSFLFGAERPAYSVSLPIAIKDIHPWLDHMKAAGIQRVMCLLAEEQLSYYQDDLLAIYANEFEKVIHIPIKDFSIPSQALWLQAMEALSDADEAQAKTVVHCSAGYGRTGLILTSWLLYRYQISVEEAISTVVNQGNQQRSPRNPVEAGKQAKLFLQEMAGQTID